jgi:hypothetical protein
LGSTSEAKDNRISAAALEDDIRYCLGILKINKPNDEIETKIEELSYTQNITFFSTYQKRLIALKIIADSIVPAYNTLTQSQLYDFLMLSTTAIVSPEHMSGNERLQGTASDIVFKIYKDLIENHETASDILKASYPRIIVDVVAVLNNGIDTSGKQVSVYRVYDYYLSRKSEPVSNIERIDVTNIILDEDKDAIEHNVNNNDLIQSLVRITGRDSREIEESLARLNKSDIGRIRSLCVNYPRIDKYCRLVATDRKVFVEEIERERGGKKLTKSQLQITVVSIKKVREYVENVLDRKFVTHSSHYINHTKHNLEYGYHVMGLIESTKRGRKEERNSNKS